MSQLLDEGKIVLTLDYAVLRFQVDHCYRISREMGYTPYVSTAELDQIFIHPEN
jgi:endo-alpha-1,4-polygalactosaminidase (GH114 family)